MIIADVVITPALAMQMMQNKVPALYDGQGVSVAKVLDFAEKMRSGKWGSAPEDSPISISDKGRLMNGLHRLFAVCESGVTITDRVAFFVPESKLESGPDDGVERSAFISECAEFILDLLGEKTRNLRTVAKIHDHIAPMIADVPGEFDRKTCAVTVACLYASIAGVEADTIKRVIESTTFDAGMMPPDLFDFALRLLLGMSENDLLSYDVSRLLPDGIYSSQVTDAG